MQTGFDPQETTRDEQCFTCCVICFQLVHRKESAKLPCLHQDFCFECIFDWSLRTNFCPLCKERFAWIQKGDGSGFLNVDDRDFNEDDQQVVICGTCGRDGVIQGLVVCDLCSKGFHLGCVGIKQPPYFREWFCDCCLSRIGGYRARIALRAMIKCGRVLTTERKRLKKLRNCNINK